ncbi:MAG: hypothetical protein ACREQ5_16410, partial [Candidatus Dormibacteria bacterium]
AWEAQKRLHHRYRHLSGRIGKPKAITAVSRELVGFVLVDRPGCSEGQRRVIHGEWCRSGPRSAASPRTLDQNYAIVNSRF